MLLTIVGKQMGPIYFLRLHHIYSAYQLIQLLNEYEARFH